MNSNAAIHAGTTDSIAAFLACAPLSRGVAVTSLGSTLAIKIVVEKRIDDPEIGLYSHRVANHWLTGGASNTGGAVLARYFSEDQLRSLSAEIDLWIPPEVDCYPLLRPGERFPVNDPYLPVRLAPRPKSDVEFLHGMLHSIARIETQCYCAFEVRGGDYPSDVFTAGGGSENPTWTAIRAGVLGIEPKKSPQSEAAVCAARLTKLFTPPQYPRSGQPDFHHG